MQNTHFTQPVNHNPAGYKKLAQRSDTTHAQKLEG
jgi:hypothetical protein